MKKHKVVKGIDKSKGSEKNETTIESECMIEVQSMKEDRMIIYNIIKYDNYKKEVQSTFDNKDEKNTKTNQKSLDRY